MWWLLLPGLLMAGCASGPGAISTNGDLKFTNEVEQPWPIKELSRRVAIRLAADSWPALVEKTKPTFAWNGCDLMWIGTNEAGRPRFVLEEAYEYHPTNQPPQFVLLDDVDAPYDEAYQAIMGYNLRTVAEIHDIVPPTKDDAGDRDDYAVAISTNPKFGTVYEIGWQRLMAGGTAHRNAERRIYLLRDKGRNWHFLGEGPEESTSHGLDTSAERKVVWDDKGPAASALRIEFVETARWSEVFDSDEETRPELKSNTEWVLAGPFPANTRRASKRDFLLTEKSDTLEKIVKRLAVWETSTGYDFYDANKEPARLAYIERVEAGWRRELLKLNPTLPPAGELPEGTRIEMLTYDEVRKLTEPMVYGKTL